MLPNNKHLAQLFVIGAASTGLLGKMLGGDFVISMAVYGLMAIAVCGFLGYLAGKNHG